HRRPDDRVRRHAGGLGLRAQQPGDPDARAHAGSSAAVSGWARDARRVAGPARQSAFPLNLTPSYLKALYVAVQHWPVPRFRTCTVMGEPTVGMIKFCPFPFSWIWALPSIPAFRLSCAMPNGVRSLSL